jgi:hypothetical protein
MEIEKELKEINERLNNIENKLNQLDYEPTDTRPAWLNVILSFVVVLIIILVAAGVFSFIVTD